MNSRCRYLIYVMDHRCNNFEWTRDRDFICKRNVLGLCDHSRIRCFKYVVKNDMFHIVFVISKVIFSITQVSIFLVKPVTYQRKLHFKIEKFSYGTVFIYRIGAMTYIIVRYTNIVQLLLISVNNNVSC